MAHWYVSIDVATRSLAMGAYRMSPFVGIGQGAPSSEDPGALNAYLNGIIQPVRMEVYDINKGLRVKETSISVKAAALKQTLEQFDAAVAAELPADATTVLVEYQMNANHGSNAIFNMIVYHYAGRYPVEVIKPTWKNTISFRPDLSLGNFLARASSNYKANKDHTRANMLFFLELTDRADAVRHIAKKNLDDIADTFMQAVAFHAQKNPAH